MRKLILTTAAGLAAVVIFLLGSLPPSPFRLALDGIDPDLQRRTVAGAYHIHTSRSDGAKAKASIAAAAARAGLGFAIFTDHGDATAAPDPPAYIEGVLCIDGVEVSTNGGHYVAIGLPPAPYPLGGEAAAVVEDVARLGGFGIAAHPDHPKPGLAWTDWRAPIDGIEWLNADSEWRDEGRLALVRTMFAYLLRPGAALASVFDRPDRTLTRWDTASRERPITALAAVDAHGGVRRGSPVAGESGPGIGPSYEASFRTISNRVILARPLTGEAGPDAGLILDAIRAGRVYSVVDAISPDVVLSQDSSGFNLQSRLPSGGQVVPVAAGDARRLEIHAPNAPGDPPVPWVLTNWMPRVRPVDRRIEWPASGDPFKVREWRVERDPESSGEVRVAGGSMSLDYRLRDGAKRSQFVAAVTDLAGEAAFSGITFQAHAARPMRVSVQLRFPPDDRRWFKSVYLDPGSGRVSVRAVDMVETDRPAGGMPPPHTARSLLFVVDLVNARPGDAGSFSLTDLRVVR